MLHARGTWCTKTQQQECSGKWTKMARCAYQLSHSLSWRTAPSQWKSFSHSFHFMPFASFSPTMLQRAWLYCSVTSHSCWGLLLSPRAISPLGWRHPSSTASPPRATSTLTRLVASVQLTGFLLEWPKLNANQVSRKGIIITLDLLATFLTSPPPNCERRSKGQEEEELKVYSRSQTQVPTSPTTMA